MAKLKAVAKEDVAEKKSEKQQLLERMAAEAAAGAGGAVPWTVPSTPSALAAKNTDAYYTVDKREVAAWPLSRVTSHPRRSHPIFGPRVGYDSTPPSLASHASLLGPITSHSTPRPSTPLRPTPLHSAPPHSTPPHPIPSRPDLFQPPPPPQVPDRHWSLVADILTQLGLRVTERTIAMSIAECRAFEQACACLRVWLVPV